MVDVIVWATYFGENRFYKHYSKNRYYRNNFFHNL